MATATPGRSKLRASLARAHVAVKLIERALAPFSPYPERPFLDPAEFPWTAEVEAGWRSIRAELDAILRRRDELPSFQDISKDQYSITRDDGWKTFFLYGYGYRSDLNCALCPETDRLLRRIPGLLTAFFSILAPGKRIPIHRGPYKGVLRYHLGLVVPEPREACAIRVGGELAHWEEGKGLVFDDTYHHEAWNETSGQRVVLFVDFVRPLRFPASALNAAVLGLIRRSPFIQDARRNQALWEARFADPQRARE